MRLIEDFELIRPVGMADLLSGREPLIASASPEPEPVTFGRFRFVERPWAGLWVATALSRILRPTRDDLARFGLRTQESPWFDEEEPATFTYEPPVWEVPWRRHSVDIRLPESMFLPGRTLEAVLLRLADLCGWFDDFASSPPLLPRVVRVAGDDESSVPPDTIKTLVDLAKQGNREDFEFLAGASGVATDKMEELWSGTRRRLGAEAAP